MAIYIAADHSGVLLTRQLKQMLLDLELIDIGSTDSGSPDDYPDIVAPCVNRVVAEGTLGVVIGGSGQGEAMVANRIPGARAVVFYGPRAPIAAVDAGGTSDADGYAIVRLGRRHNNANILSLGARFVTAEEAAEAIRIFIDTPFSAEDRHTRRIAKF